MLKFIQGNMFSYDADIMINTVNCVGTMGKGVALKFKERFPEMFDYYKRECRSKNVRPGEPFVWQEKDIFAKDIEVINFPTKRDWRHPSRYDYIENGLEWLSDYLSGKSNKLVTLPALGCGNGGLDWETVRPMIVKKLENSPACIYVFEPKCSPNLDKYSAMDCRKKIASPEVETVKYRSEEYPKNLMKYTQEDLYLYPERRVIEYDYAVVYSSHPKDEEINLIKKFIDFCAVEKSSILFGGTGLGKKLAIDSFKKGIVCGCFLPSGIFSSVRKIIESREKININLLSIGNPEDSIESKESMRYLFARFSLSKRVIFFTKNLSWVGDNKRKFKTTPVEVYYFISEGMPDNDKKAMLDIEAKGFYSDVKFKNFFIS